MSLSRNNHASTNGTTKEEQRTPCRGSLSCPNVKLLSFHLKTAQPLVNSAGKLKRWSVTYNKNTHNFSTVWVQGEIVQINIEEESVIIKDHSGQILLVEASLKPETVEDLYILEKKQYVMAVGEFISNTDIPTIRVQKLKKMDEGRDELSSLWPLEVQHQLKYATVTL